MKPTCPLTVNVHNIQEHNIILTHDFIPQLPDILVLVNIPEHDNIPKLPNILDTIAMCQYSGT